MEIQKRKLCTNLNTNLPKLVVIAAMLVGHTGGASSPEIPVFRWIGWLAFPLLCYCLMVGLFYTHDIRRYLGWLAIFVVVSQPFWILAFNADDTLDDLANWNIFSILFLSPLAMWGLTTRRWWLFVLGVLVLTFGSFDYNYNGVILMLISYFCWNKSALLAELYIPSRLPVLWGDSLGDPLALVVGGHAVNWTIFALLALPLILCRTHSGPRTLKWSFYTLYPAHLAIIALVGGRMGVQSEKERVGMKILLLNGSPRPKGNTAATLDETEAVFVAEGLEIERVQVGSRVIRGRIACSKCTELGRCVFDDLVNELAPKLEVCDGPVVGSLVYCASANATLVALLTRLFHSTPSDKIMKMGAAATAARRGGLSSTFDELNKFFTISDMPVASSRYWSSIHGRLPDEAAQDAEGLQTMCIPIRNMAFLIKNIALGREKYGLPEREEPLHTHFIR